MVSSGVINALAGILFFFSMVFGLRSFIVFSLLFVFIHVSTRLWCKASIRHVHYDLILDKKRVFPGESFALDIELENAKLLPIGFRIDVPPNDLFRSTFTSNGFNRQGTLMWFQKVTFNLKCEAACRGIYEIGSANLIIGDLFDFFQNELSETPSRRLIVYPRIVELSPFFISPKALFGIPKAKTPVLDPVYIEGTRDYQSGSPSKYIHWKASARYLRLQEKIFEPTVQQKILFVLDVKSFFENNADTPFERTIEVIASIAVQYDRIGYPIGLMTNGHVNGNGGSVVPISKTPQQLAAILESLAGVNIKPSGNVGALLNAGLALSSGVSCIYASYSNDHAFYDAHAYFNQINIPVVSVISCPDATHDRIIGTCFTIDDICGKNALIAQTA